MSNPLRWFRQNSKVFMVVFGIAAMFIFGLGSIVTMLNPSALFGGAGANEGNVVVATWNGGSFTKNDINRFVTRHHNTMEFLAQLQQFARTNAKDSDAFRSTAIQITPIGSSGNSSEGVIQGRVVTRYLLAQKARNEGLVVGQGMVTDYLSMICGGTPVSLAQMKQLNREVNNKNVAWKAILRHLETELAARHMEFLAGTSLPRVPNATESIQFYDRTHRVVECKVLPFKVEDYIDKVTGSPTSSELRTLFDEGRYKLEDPSGKTPGFIQGKKVSAKYFIADFNAFLENEMNKLTDEEVQKEYDRLVKAENYMVMETVPQEEKPADKDAPAEADDPALKPKTESETPETDDKAPKPATDTDPAPLPKLEGAKSTDDAAKQVGDDKKSEAGKSEAGKAETEKVNAKKENTEKSESGKTESEKTGEKKDNALLSVDSADQYVSLPAQKQDENQEEAKKQDPPTKQDPPVTQKAAEQETAKQEKATEEKTAENKTEKQDDATKDAKTADTSAADTTAADPTTQEAKSTEESKADPAADASKDQDPTKPEILGPEMGDAPKIEKRVRPLSEVADDIKRSLKSRDAQLAIETALRKAEGKVRAYQIQLNLMEARKDLYEEGEKPTEPDFAAIAKELNLTYNETKLLNRKEMRKEPLGEIVFYVNQGNQRQVPVNVSDLIFETYDKTQPNEPNTVPDQFNRKTYLYWLSEKQDQKVLTLGEATDRVTEYWRHQKAVEMATAEATKVASGINDSKNLMSVANPEAVDTGEFSWYSFLGQIMFGMPTGVVQPGEDFMKVTFSLAPLEAGVAANVNSDTIYAIQLVKADEKSLEDIGDEYLDKQLFTFKRLPFDVEYLSNRYTEQINYDWLDEFTDEMGLEWNEQ